MKPCDGYGGKPLYQSLYFYVCLKMLITKIKFKIIPYYWYKFTTFCPFFSLEPLYGKSPKILIWGYKDRTAGQTGSTDE